MLEIGQGPAIVRKTRRWRKAKPEPADCSWDSALGASAMTVRVMYREDESAGVRDEKLEKACRAFAGYSVRGVVVPKGFTRHDMLASYGLAAADPMALYRRLAPRMIDAVRRQTPFIAGVMAARVTPEVRETVYHLTRSVRYLFLRCPGGGEALAAEVRRDTGLTVFSAPSDMALSSSEVLIVFDPVPENGRSGSFALPVRDSTTVLLLTRKLTGRGLRQPARIVCGARLTPPPRLMPVWPASCDAGALLMALYAQQAVMLEEIGIEL